MRSSFIILAVTAVVARARLQICNKNLTNKELKNRTFNGMIYEEGEYFVDNETGVERGCVCLKEICLRKCCPFGMGYDIKLFKCVNLKDQFNPRAWEGPELKKEGYNAAERFIFDNVYLNCTNQAILLNIFNKTDDYELTTDGKLRALTLLLVPVKIRYNSDKYCLDNFLNSNVTIQGAIVCFKQVNFSPQLPVKAFCLLVSSFFMILTIVVYIILPDLRKSIHGMVMIAFLLSFFVCFFSLAIMHILYSINVSRLQCTILTFVVYFSMITGFFWLNVMCYDVWKKFRTINVATSDGLSRDECNKFLWYCLYALGVPTALTVLLAILEFSGLEHKLLPNLRSGDCFISGTSRMIYLYSPMLFTCCLNLIFIVLVAIKIAKIKKQTQRLERKDTQVFRAIIKLFTLTGCTWIFEVISASYPEFSAYLIFTDYCNIFFGIVIFTMFVCKKKIITKIKVRYVTTMGISSTENTT